MFHHTKKKSALKNILTNGDTKIYESQLRDENLTENYSGMIINNEIMEECFENAKNEFN